MTDNDAIVSLKSFNAQLKIGYSFMESLLQIEENTSEKEKVLNSTMMHNEFSLSLSLITI